MKKFAIFASLLISTAVTAAVFPADEELVLPKMVLEIEQEPPQAFEALLPPSPEPEAILPPFEISDGEILAIPDGILDPDVMSVQDFLYSRLETEPSFFSEGTLGAGSMNGITGGLSLYKTGGDLRFRLLFSHEGMDGYDFRDPGTGFSRREEKIEGRVDLRTGPGDVEVRAGFRETEEGLQGLSPVYSAVHRFVSGAGAFTFRPAEQFALRGELRGAFAGRLLTVPDPSVLAFDREGAEYTAGANLGGSWTGDTFAVSLSADYGLRGVDGYDGLSVGRFAPRLGGEYRPREGWKADAYAGFFRSDRTDFFFPFEAGVAGGVGDGFTFSLRGGLRAEENDYRNLWPALGLLRIQEDFEDGKTWFAAATLGMKSREDTADFRVGFEVMDREKAVVLEDFDASRSEFPFRQEDLLSFVLRADLRFRLLPGLFVTGYGKTILEDRAFLEPAHRYGTGLEYAPPSKRYGLSLSAGWDTGDETAVPDLRFEGRIKPFEGLDFVLSAEDLLSPLPDGGRTSTYPFIAPGFRVMLKTVLSF